MSRRERSRSTGVVLALGAAVLAALAAACPAPARDVVPDTRDVRLAPGADAGEPPPRKEGYIYVARRPRASVGLVGSRSMSEADAQRLVDRIADDLDACARRVEQRGELASGALQLVAIAGPRGNGEVTDLRLAPGGPVAANALECVVAPLRASVFPAAPGAAAPGTSGAAPIVGLPTIAIEATWGPGSAGDAGGGL